MRILPVLLCACLIASAQAQTLSSTIVAKCNPAIEGYLGFVTPTLGLEFDQPARTIGVRQDLLDYDSRGLLVPKGIKEVIPPNSFQEFKTRSIPLGPRVVSLESGKELEDRSIGRNFTGEVLLKIFTDVHGGAKIIQYQYQDQTTGNLRGVQFRLTYDRDGRCLPEFKEDVEFTPGGTRTDPQSRLRYVDGNPIGKWVPVSSFEAPTSSPSSR